MPGRWVALWVLLSLDAHAWGADGHRIIGEIAWQRLSAPARAALTPLLAHRGVGSLAEAAVWADAVGRAEPQYAWARPLHYINVPLHADTVHLDAQSCPEGEGGPGPSARCVVSAVGFFAARLADPAAPLEERADALLWLSHFVGDLHQPLHVAHRDMRGGNTIDLTVRGEHTSLHAYWDTGLVRARLAGAPWRDVAASLDAAITRSEARRWRRGVPARVSVHGCTEWARRWAEQVLEVAQTPALFGQADFATLPDDYAVFAAPILDALLQAAGVRLAALLELAVRPG